MAGKRIEPQRLRIDEEQADRHERHQRHDLEHRERGVDRGGLADAADVDPRVSQHQQRDAERAHARVRQLRPENLAVVHGEVGYRGAGADARDPQQPADGESGRRAQRLRRVELRPAGAIEAAADFGEAQRDQRHQQAAGDDDRHAVVADQRLDLRRAGRGCPSPP